MEFHVLASGSKGNSTFIYTNGIGILIDCGITRKQLLFKLENLGFSENQIDCVLLTHDHNDHNKNIHIFDNKKVYAGLGCVDGLPKQNIIYSYQPIGFNTVEITPLPISHDATKPFGFVINDGSEVLVYMTDTGYVSQKNMKFMANAHYYIIESNHDINMLMACKRPDFLKKRILSDVGHLSNDYSAQLICKVLGDNTKEIILAHLSQDANTPELALNTYKTLFEHNNLNFDDFKIVPACQVNVVSGGSKSED